MNVTNTAAAEARAAFDRLLGELRPKLHRYCARMTGSVIDGEDVVQEAMVKAIEALSDAGSLVHPEGWLFRIAHNAALDFLRRRARRDAAHSDLDPDMVVDEASSPDDGRIAAMSLRAFMRLPPAQRSCVILMDVLGDALREVGEVTDLSIPAVKAALHRGRAHLRELAHEGDDRAPHSLTEGERSLLAAYIDRFNARDFDAVRDMLAEEVRLDLVARARMNGRREVAKYFGNYSLAHDWQLVPGFVEGRPAALVRDPNDPSSAPGYFILLDWVGDRLVRILDFRHARYVLDGAELVALP